MRANKPPTEASARQPAGKLGSGAFIHCIATAVPPHMFSQEHALAFMQRYTEGGLERAGFLKRIHRQSAIQYRHSVLQDYGRDCSEFTFYPRAADLHPLPTTAQRNAVYAKESQALALAVSQAVFSPPQADSYRVGSHRIDPFSITHLITVSCTGFVAPGFDLAIQKQLLDDNVNRTHIGFMGCYAAFPALKLARSICLADPNAKVLVVCVELCSLHLQWKWEPDLAVANALFADGAAAVLISAAIEDSSAASPLYELLDFESRVLADTHEDMSWQIGDTGFEMKLSSYVPRAISSNIAPIVDELLHRNNVTRADISRWAIHPGGRAILDHAAATLDLSESALSSSYQVLERFGNMSSATICFVLADIARSATPQHVYAAAFGPGLTVESALLRSFGGQ